MTIVLTPPPEPAEVDLTETYDAIVVGSGAAGGMAAHVLTSHGLKVLLLEAGKKLNIEQELHSMQWPYDHPRRGDDAARLPCALAQRVHHPQAALRRKTVALQARLLVRRRLGRLRLRRRTSSSTRRDTRTPARTTPGCARACSAARRTSGAGSRCASPTTTSRPKIARRLRRGLADLLHATSSRTTTASISTSASPATRKNLPHLPDSLFQRPTQAERAPK